MEQRDEVDEVLTQWSRRRPDLDSSGLGLVLRIQALADVFAERLKTLLSPFGLAPWEFEVLAALRRAKRGGCTPTELCSAARLTSGAMTHRLDRLSERGLLARSSSSDDRRSVRVTLTAQGRRTVDRVLGVRMEDARTCLGDLGRREQRELLGLLRRLGRAPIQEG